MGNYNYSSNYVNKCISGNVFRDNSGAILNAGNTAADSPITEPISQITNNTPIKRYGQTLFAATGVASSGNWGAIKAVSGSTFAGWYDGKYVMTKYGYVAGVANNLLNTGSSDTSQRRPILSFVGYSRLHITSWNAATGSPTFGNGRGAKVYASGINGTVGRNADDAVRLSTLTQAGELTIFTAKLNAPTQLDYATSTNP